MPDIFRIENYLQESYRETAKNRDVLTGWSTLDDVSAREKMSPDMHPSTYSFDPENLSMIAQIGGEFIAAHQKRVMRARQFKDDLFDVYYQEATPLYANSKFADLVRGQDGDVHEYVAPVRLWSIPDESLVDETYTGIWVRRLVPTIDVEKSRVDRIEWYRAIKEPPNRKSYFLHLKALTPEGQVVYRSALDAGLSVWRDRDTRALFCTKEFRERARDVGYRGLKFTECTVLDQ